MNKQIKKQTYKNAISYKGDNRRVTVINDDDSFELDFRIVDGDTTIPRAESYLLKNKMVVTKIKISKEAGAMLLDALSILFKQILK